MSISATYAALSEDLRDRATHATGGDDEDDFLVLVFGPGEVPRSVGIHHRRADPQEYDIAVRSERDRRPWWQAVHDAVDEGYVGRLSSVSQAAIARGQPMGSRRNRTWNSCLRGRPRWCRDRGDRGRWCRGTGRRLRRLGLYVDRGCRSWGGGRHCDETVGW